MASRHRGVPRARQPVRDGRWAYPWRGSGSSWRWLPRRGSRSCSVSCRWPLSCSWPCSCWWRWSGAAKRSSDGAGGSRRRYRNTPRPWAQPWWPGSSGARFLGFSVARSPGDLSGRMPTEPRRPFHRGSPSSAREPTTSDRAWRSPAVIVCVGRVAHSRVAPRSASQPVRVGVAAGGRVVHRLATSTGRLETHGLCRAELGADCG